MTGQLERLTAAGIQPVFLPQISSHFIFERDGFAALVERTAEGFGQIGSAGLITEHGLAVLVWREEQALFVAKGFQRMATLSEIEQLRRFAADLERALRA
jgi:hypothetical protein